jgi:hypothetical protein
MKSTTFLAVMAFAATHASAIPSPDAEPDARHVHGYMGFCSVPGMFCASGKRSVDEAALCGAPGEDCHSIKQAAHSIGSILNEADKHATEPSYCSVDGQPCHKANGFLAKIAEKARESYSRVYAREADAVAEARHVHGYMGFCSVPGMFCASGKRDAEAEASREKLIGCVPGKFCPTGDRKHDPESHHAAHGSVGVAGLDSTPWLVGRDAVANPNRGHWIGYSNHPGFYSIGGKRSAEADPRHVHGYMGFCSVPGMFCAGGKRSDEHLEGFCDAPGVRCEIGRTALEKVKANPSLKAHLKGCGANGTPCLVHKEPNFGKREAEAEADPRHVHGYMGFCSVPGMFCASGKRDAAPNPRHVHGYMGFCSVPGMFCASGKRSNEPAPFCPANAPCLSGPDAQKVVSILSQNDPKFLKNECYKPGNECHTILKIHGAFNQMRKEAQAAKQEQDPNQELARCTSPNAKCSVLTLKHADDKYRNKSAIKQAEHECNSAQGYCTEAKRDLDELASIIDESVAELGL